MSQSSHQTQPFTVGQPVTVTIDDGHGETLVIDGFVQRTDLYVHTDLSRGPFASHTAMNHSFPGVRQHLVIESASAKDFGHGLDRWRTSPDHAFFGATVWVAVEPSIDGPRASVCPSDEDALARIDATLSPQRILAKAVAALSQTDPTLAQRLVGAVEEIETDAYTRGGDAASAYY